MPLENENVPQLLKSTIASRERTRDPPMRGLAARLVGNQIEVSLFLSLGEAQLLGKRNKCWWWKLVEVGREAPRRNVENILTNQL